VGVFQLTADTLLVEVPRGLGGKHYALDPLSSQETYSQRLVYGRSGAALGLRVVPFAILLADRYAWLPLDLGTRETRGACHKGVCCLRVTVCARHLSLVAVIARASSVTQPLEAGEQGVGSLRLPGGERRDGPRHVDRRIAIVQRCRDTRRLGGLLRHPVVEIQGDQPFLPDVRSRRIVNDAVRDLRVVVPDRDAERGSDGGCHDDG